MKREETKYWTIGVDEGEEEHSLVVLDDQGERISKPMRVPNRSDKIEEALAKIKLKVPTGYQLQIAAESLRSLGGVLARVAIALDFELWQVNPKALNHYRDLEGQPRKDDDTDGYLAGRMVHFGMKGCHLAVDVKPEERCLCRLTRLHTQLTNQKTAIMNMIRSRLLELSPEVLSTDWEGPEYDTKAMAAVLGRWPGFIGVEKTKLSAIERVLMRAGYRSATAARGKAKVLKEMARRIVMLQEERRVVAMELAAHLAQYRVLLTTLRDIDSEMAERVKGHEIGRRLEEMPGVGTFTAAVLIGEILPLARNLPEGETATYAGVTPLSRISGKPANGRPSKLARGINKHVIHALYLSATSARRVSAIDRQYYRKQYERHQGHPRPHTVATISLARQRFKVMYKLLTTDAVYDKEILIAKHFERRNKEQTQAA